MPTQFLAAQVVIPDDYDWWDENAEAYYVSTINRDSDVWEGDMYSETIVFEWDIKSQKKGKILYQTSHARNSLYLHKRIVHGLEESGMKYIEEINNQE